MKTPSRRTGKLLHFFFITYPKESLLAIIALLFAGFAETLGIGALLPLISIITESDQAADNSLANIIFDIYKIIGIEPNLSNLLLTIVFTMVLKAIITFQAMRYVSYVATDVSRDFRIKLITALMQAKWSYFSGLSIGGISNFISSEATRAGQCYLLFGRTIAAFIQTLIYILAAFIVSWKVSLIAICMGIIVAIMLKGFISMSRKAGNDLSTYMKEMIAQLNESLSGIKPLKAMGQEFHYINKLNLVTSEVMQARKKQALTNLLMQIAYEPIAVILLAAGLFYVLTYTNTPVASVILLAFLFYRLLTQANLLQSFYQNMVQNEAAVWHMTEEIERAEVQKEILDKGEAPIFNDSIIIRDITISHDNQTEIFTGFSAEIPKNKLTVVFGPSGVGKTSLVDALLGMLPLKNGSIFIGKKNLQDIDLTAWRQKIGYVPQETFLFHDSVFQNVTLGDKKYSESDVREALEKAGGLSFVGAMEKTIDAVVGERGGKLSGGQKQRIALARAIIRMPELLVLDESTTGLDPDTEDQILNTLKTLSKEMTIIMISHNPKVLKIADHVINLDTNTN